MKSKAPNNYIYGIDLIRFICAAMVMLFHLGFTSWASPTANHPGFKIHSLERFAQPGWVGVEIFFVISGYVVAGAASVATSSAFIKGRILRLYPAVWICASLTLLVRLLDGGSIQLFHPYIASLLLYPKGPWIDGQYWTLATEMAFYALILLLIASTTISRIGTFAIALALLSTILVVALQIHPGTAWLVTLSNLRYVPIYNGSDFALGIFIWLWAQGRLEALTTCGAIVSIGAGSLQIYQGNVFDNARTFPATGYYFSAFVPIFLWIAGSGLIVLSIVFKRHFDNLPLRVRSVIRTLGLMTYPVYLLHYAIGIAGMTIMIKQGMNPIAAMLIMMTIISAVALSVCTSLEPLVKKRLQPVLDRVDDRFGRSLRSADTGTS